ncbi:MAG: IS200/IS605 family transposase [Oscillospiraceae bacterium]|nr:IS200/IS605 family transposase [Oscillospiraceae bacterium]
MELDTNAHSVFSMYYHLVLVTKYRRDVINDVISARAKEIFAYIAPTYKITVEEWNPAEYADISTNSSNLGNIEHVQPKDHIHVLFKAHPKSELSKFINAYKSASSRLIKKEHPEIQDKLWSEYRMKSLEKSNSKAVDFSKISFWSQSFCLLTTGGVTIDVIRQYIESQGEK